RLLPAPLLLAIRYLLGARSRLSQKNWLADIHLRAFSNRCVAPASHLRKGVQVASSSCGWTGAEARYTIAQPRNATAKPRINTVVICASRFTASSPRLRFEGRRPLALGAKLSAPR